MSLYAEHNIERLAAADSDMAYGNGEDVAFATETTTKAVSCKHQF